MRAADKDLGLPEVAPPFLNWQAASPPHPHNEVLWSPGLAFKEESRTEKEVWACPKGKVTISFLHYLSTKLGYCQARELDERHQGLRGEGREDTGDSVNVHWCPLQGSIRDRLTQGAP